MQVGDIVSGSNHASYLAVQPLGTPGLFGQAFLCRRTDDNAEVVVKTLRVDRPAEDRERFFMEADTLERIAQYEEDAGVHYAVRLLDQSAPDAPETFLVLERASGLNVLDDIVERVADWQNAPLDEHIALEIACLLAHALTIVHQAGICYDDMKLDNLFWNPEQPGDPLRIIDWNVTSTVAERGGVAGDWARFGARLYELRTGSRIGVSHDGSVLGNGPNGQLWQQLPEGLRDLIEQALRLRYADDETLLRDLRREREQARMTWPDLLERATIADGAGQTIEVLAPLARAERQIQALPLDDPQREGALAHCAELRSRAAMRRGQAGARALDNAIQALARDEARLAVERFQKAYADTGSRDARPRRWLWLARLAVDQAKRYRALRGEVEAAVDALNHDDPATALTHLSATRSGAVEAAPLSWLVVEAKALLLAAQDDFAGALAGFEQLGNLIDQFPDMKFTRDELLRQYEAQQRREAARARESELWEAATTYANQGRSAEARGDEQRALQYYERALDALARLLAGGCSPELEESVRASKHMLSERLEHLSRQVQARQIPVQARSPDPRQRRVALKLAEELLPDWPDLPNVREQMRQIDACMVVLDRSQSANRLMAIDQALAAIDALDRAGVKLDNSGTELQIVRRQLLDRRAGLKNGHARARLQEAAVALDEATAQVSQARYDDALRMLSALDEHSLDAEVRDELRQLSQRAEALGDVLARTTEQLTQIQQARAMRDFNTALRLAHRLSVDNPQLPHLADEVATLEQELWADIAASTRQLAEEYMRLTLKQATAEHLHALDARAIQLNSQRQVAERPGALAPARRDPLRASADHHLHELERARELWRRRREDTIAELSTYLTQIEHALAQNDAGMAHQKLVHVRETYIPEDARAQGMEPLLIKIERLHAELLRRRDNVILQLRDLETRLDDASASVWYEELSETFHERPVWLDPEGQAIWQRVQSRAFGLRQLIDRIHHQNEGQIFERVERLETVLREQEPAGERRERAIRQDIGVLREELRRDSELLRSVNTSLQENFTKTDEMLQAHRKAMLGTMLSLFLGMLIVVTLVVILT
jgi:hypothetical protein